MKINKNNKLIDLIMEYWRDCAYRDGESDWLINDLVYEYAKSIGIYEEKLNYDIYLTVSNMTNSQKRKLLKLMQESKIK